MAHWPAGYVSGVGVVFLLEALACGDDKNGRGLDNTRKDLFGCPGESLWLARGIKLKTYTSSSSP